MTPLKRAAAAALMGLQWSLLALATGARRLADHADDAAWRLRR